MMYKIWMPWCQRQETTWACAMHFAGMLEGLAAIHPDLGRWNKQAETRVAANEPLFTWPPLLADLEAIFNKGRRFASASGELVPQLGFSISAWNGLESPRGLSLSITAGAYTNHIPQPNIARLEGLDNRNTSLVNCIQLHRVLLTIAEHWNVNWGVVETWSYKGQILDEAGFPSRPWGGWLTYLSAMYADKVVPPPEIHAERLPNGGLYMLATEEPFDADNPVHVARLDAIQRALAPAQRIS